MLLPKMLTHWQFEPRLPAVLPTLRAGTAAMTASRHTGWHTSQSVSSWQQLLVQEQQAVAADMRCKVTRQRVEQEAVTSLYTLLFVAEFLM